MANGSFTLGYASGPPVITSTGTDAATGLIWEVRGRDATGAGAYLGAWGLLPVPRSGGGAKLREIWAAPVGTSAKFCVVATDNGMVHVGTRDGHVLGFGRTGAAALTTSGSAQFRETPLGSSSSKRVSVTATGTVTVTGASADAESTPDPFTLGLVTLTRRGSGTPEGVRFPVTLHKGDVLRATAKFAPTLAGGADGVVSFTTAAKPAVPVSVPLIGNGTSTGLFLSNDSLTFHIIEHDGLLIEDVPVGRTATAMIRVINAGNQPSVMGRSGLPGGPFAAPLRIPNGLPVNADNSLVLPVAFHPVKAGAYHGTYQVTWADRFGQHSLNVPITGTGVG